MALKSGVKLPPRSVQKQEDQADALQERAEAEARVDASMGWTGIKVTDAKPVPGALAQSQANAYLPVRWTPNDFFVKPAGDSKVQIGRVVSRILTPAEALNLAAWLIACACPGQQLEMRMDVVAEVLVGIPASRSDKP